MPYDYNRHRRKRIESEYQLSVQQMLQTVLIESGTPSGAGGGGAPFTNTYSLDFDGVDDSVITYPIYSALDGLLDFAYSFWIKMDTLVGYQNIFGISNQPQSDVRAQKTQLFWNPATSRLQVYFDNLSYYCRTDAALWTPVVGTWYHALITRSQSRLVNDRCRFYIDGNNVTESENTGNHIFNTNATSGIYIGDNIGLSYSPFSGNIDEFAIYTQDMADYVSEIYNSGTPDDLDNLATAPAPNVWYRMGENSTFSSQILMPENSNKDKVSNYSMEFDGTDDYINVGITNFPTSLTDNFSVSFWVRMAPVSLGTYTRRHPVSVATSVSDLDQSVHLRAWNTQYLVRLIGSLSGGGTGTTDISDNQWHNIIYTYSYDVSTTYYTVNIYVDGNTTPEVTAVMRTTGGYATQGLHTIGVLSDYAAPYNLNAGTYFPGNIDEVSIFNTVLSTGNVTSIYNSGTPADLTSLSPVSWWRMGEEATFSTNWTIPDQIGSNNGTSANMTIEDRVGDAPNSSNNSLSYNMDAADIVEDTPQN